MTFSIKFHSWHWPGMSRAHHHFGEPSIDTNDILFRIILCIERLCAERFRAKRSFKLKLISITHVLRIDTNTRRQRNQFASALVPISRKHIQINRILLEQIAIWNTEHSDCDAYPPQINCIFQTIKSARTEIYCVQRTACGYYYPSVIRYRYCVEF